MTAAWHALGLVSPSARAHNGYRLYDAEDVGRLYQVLALRRHLQVVEREPAEASALRERLVRLLQAVGDGAVPDEAELLELLEHMAMIERYSTPAQLQRLAARAGALGAEGMAKAQRDWAELIAAVQAERAKGTDPADSVVQELMRRWREMIEAFTGGDEGARAGLQRLSDEEGPERASRGMGDEALKAYVRNAMEAGA